MTRRLIDAGCFACDGHGNLVFEVPHGVWFSKHWDEVAEFKPKGPCDLGDPPRIARFKPQRNGWPQLPQGLQYSHLCHDPRCGNPAHFVVTTLQINNLMEGARRAETP